VPSTASTQTVTALFVYKEYDRALCGQKILLFSESLYEKVLRVNQHLLALFSRQGHSNTCQHPSHAREQQLKLRQPFFSRPARHKRQ
jgi:hypothetical protein